MNAMLPTRCARVVVFLLAALALGAPSGSAQSASQPRLVQEFTPGPDGGAIGDFGVLGEELIFGAASADPAGGWAVWKSDGTADGTVELRHLEGADDFEPLDGFLYFSGSDVDFGAELWRTDGTPAGTERVTDLVPGPGHGSPRSLTVVGDELFFDGFDAGGGRAIYKSDGTTAGTTLVKTFSPRGNAARLLTAAGGKLFFVAGDFTPEGRELWVSDGTDAGTHMVKDINPGVFPSHPEYLTNLSGVLVFSAQSPEGGEELWRTDGTLDGTRQVADIRPGPEGAGAEFIVAHDGQVFFGASGDEGAELWRSDGINGAQLVADIAPGPDDSEPMWLTSLGGHIYFAASRPDLGTELWRSDGTTAELVADINPGAGSSYPAPVFDSSGESPVRLATSTREAFFLADDGAAGYELWRSDGTQAGTERAGDINPGPASSYPEGMTVAGRDVFFRAQEPSSGRELWALELAASPPPPRPGDAVVQVVQGSASTPPFPSSPLTFGLSGILGDATVPLELLDLSLTSACSRLQPGDPCRELALAQSVRCQLTPGDPCREARVETACARFIPGDPCLEGNQAVDLFVELRPHPSGTAAPVLQPATLANMTATGFDVVYNAVVPGVAAMRQTLRFAIGAGQPYAFANVEVGTPQSPRFHVTFELERLAGEPVAGPLWTIVPSGTVAPPPADTSPPELSVPDGLVVDATSPSGAAVDYAVSARDDQDADPTIACAPASGSVLAIGTTTVECTATDDAGNAATKAFDVRVRGASEQIVRLIEKTLAYVDRPALRPELAARLKAAAEAVLARRHAAACTALAVYVTAVRLAPASVLTAAEKSELIADATRIRAVIGC